MTFATQLATAGKRPIYIAEFEGDQELALNATTGWSIVNAAANIATALDAKYGNTASLEFDKTGTGSTFAGIVNTTLTAMDLADHAYLTLRAYIPNVANITTVVVRLGSDSSNYNSWSYTVQSADRGAWIRLYLSTTNTPANYTMSTLGTPDMSAVDYMFFRLTCSTSATTFADCRISGLLGHPYRFSTAPVTTPRADTKSWMRTPPRITPQEYRVQDGALSSASATFSLLDADAGTVLAMVSDYAMRGRLVRVWMGFRQDSDIDANFQVIFTGVMEQPAHEDRSWTFQAIDLLRLLDRPFMQDATAVAPVTITGNAIDMLLQVLLSTGGGANDATYDVLTAVRGAGVHYDLVDVATMESERDTYMPSDDASFTFVKPEPSVLRWFFDEVCRGYGVAPKFSAEGLLSVRVVRGPIADESIMDLDMEDNLVVGSVPAYEPQLDAVSNQIRILWDYDAATDTFAEDTADTYQDTDSIARYGVRELVIESRGLVDTAVVARVANRYLDRLPDGAPPIDVTAHASAMTVELADVVALYLPDVVPNVEAATYSVSGLFAEVTKRGFDPLTAKLTLRCNITSFRAGIYRKIGPTTLTTDYDGSTAEQQAAYGFIADGSDTLGAGADTAHVVAVG